MPQLHMCLLNIQLATGYLSSDFLPFNPYYLLSSYITSICVLVPSLSVSKSPAEVTFAFSCRLLSVSWFPQYINKQEIKKEGGNEQGQGIIQLGDDE